VWRYHPVTREFELFCEGGNDFGVTLDDAGNLFYSSNQRRDRVPRPLPEAGVVPDGRFVVAPAGCERAATNRAPAGGTEAPPA